MRLNMHETISNVEVAWQANRKSREDADTFSVHRLLVGRLVYEFILLLLLRDHKIFFDDETEAKSCARRKPIQLFESI